MEDIGIRIILVKHIKMLIGLHLCNYPTQLTVRSNRWLLKGKLARWIRPQSESANGMLAPGNRETLIIVERKMRKAYIETMKNQS